MEPLNKELSWWKTHEYKRRSVSMVESFVGWPIMESLVKNCKTPRDQALVCALMETGGRISEVLQLNSNMFSERKNHIVVIAMPLVKQWKKIRGEKGEYVREKQTRTRTFPIPKNEPLAQTLFEWGQVMDGRLFKIGRSRAYQIITALDPSIFPHWFRAQRASQLASEYGFTIHDLIDFFGWKDLQTAIHYSRMGWKGLASKMV